MLPSSHRIRSEKFPAVTRGRVLQNELFRVVISAEEGLVNPKCAVIVPNKLAKSAVARNRIRRQAYAALELMLEKLPAAHISVFPRKVPMASSEVATGLGDLFS